MYWRAQYSLLLVEIVFLLLSNSFRLFSCNKVLERADAEKKCSYQEYLFNKSDLKTFPIKGPHCPYKLHIWRNSIYILYDINIPEGFNLRRDVYIRLAVFIKHLRKKAEFQNVRLVLPPWRRLYHWKSIYVQQDNLPWSTFFDIESLRRYAPVLDYPEFLSEMRDFGCEETASRHYVPVHKTLQLMHFKEMFENGVFRDKYEFIDESSRECRKEQHLHGYLLQQPELLDNDFYCVRYQGSVNLLERIFRRVMKQQAADDLKVYAVLNTEIVLHDHWGDREFWRARRSMRFAHNLVQIASEYRAQHFRSNDKADKVQRPPMWESEKSYRGAVGGAYLCAHLRRGDFVHGRESTTPTLKSAALQVRQALQQLNLTDVYLATDASAFEFKNLKAYLQRARVFRFTTESLEQKAIIKDGGIAIIDQIICSHARHFIGTYESTFTYRIYEEREILGFSKSSTFNTFCKSETLANCSKNSVWPIVY